MWDAPRRGQLTLLGCHPLGAAVNGDLLDNRLAILAGAVIGAVNGLLVVKARINSFIVTLGMMTIVTSVMQIYSGGGSLSLNDFSLALDRCKMKDSFRFFADY